MTLAGYLLALLNVLAAIGFFVMAGLDWGVRQAWADAAVQEQLMIDGLPLDNKNDRDSEGNPKVWNIRKPVLDQMFSRAGGSPVDTQMKELERVRGKIKAHIEDGSTRETRSQKLAWVLLAFAETETERQQRFAQMAAPPDTDQAKEQAKEEQLQKEYDEACAPALAPPSKPVNHLQDNQGGPAQPDEPRRRMAHVLFPLEQVAQEWEPNAAGQAQQFLGSSAYTRFLVVVGLVSAMHELDDQDLHVQRLAYEAWAEIDRDRAAFLQKDKYRLEEIEALSERVARQENFLKIQQSLAVKHKELVEGRRLELDRLTKDLTAAQNATAEELKVQARMEKALFDSRVDLAEAFKKNQELERQIRSLEKGR